MDDLGVIDRFTETFVTYIDSGFGLLAPDIAFLTAALIGIDVTLAGLFWALSEDKAVVPALIKKVLYVGTFAFILNNFSGLANIVFASFAGLGLQATAAPLSADDLMRPGFVAAAGYDAAKPILEATQELLGPIAFFENFAMIAVLMVAWLVVLLAFFVLAIQLFITILEFKLTTLAGFVLVPFALWGKTAFLAERVLGNVVAAGIKLMVLAVIVGIGSTIFSEFADSLSSGEISQVRALAAVLGALAIFILGIFGPGIAAGLVSGAPQLGAGAVAGPAAGLVVGGGAAAGAALSGVQALRSGAGATTRAAAALAGSASASYQSSQAASGSSGTPSVVAGMAGMARAAGGAIARRAHMSGGAMAADIRQAYGAGRGAFAAGDGHGTGGTGAPRADGGSAAAPAWAQKLRREQRLRDGAMLAAHTLRDGDRPGAGEAPRLKDDE